MEKQCFKCGETKPVTEFYKHSQMADGYLGKCKRCAKKDESERREGLIVDPDWRKKERARAREKYHRLYKGNGNNGTTGAKRAWSHRNAVKKAAMTMVRNAVRTGRLVKLPCEECGDENAQAHHDDYFKPLEVRWLCVEHHNAYHVNLKDREDGLTR